MNTIIINLSYHKNRKYDMIEKLKETNINNYFFYDAIDGNKLNDNKFNIIPEWFDYFKNRYITVGEIGCALSHYNIWKYIVNNKIKKTLILEDDVIFLDNFNYMYDTVLNLDLYYDIFFLARNSLNKYIKTIGNDIIINNFIVKPTSSYNAHSYILTYEGAKKLINTHYLNNLLPVDDYLSIMYDENYPFKQYSKYFQIYDKLKCYSLKEDITNQNTNYYGSIIDNSNIYIKNIKDEYINSNIMTTTWNIELNNILYNPDFDTFSNEINNYIDFSEYQTVNFLLNHNKDSFCFIEKIIFDNINFHTKRLNVELNDKYISFWSKKHEYNYSYIHMHIDHCDYESRIYDTEKKHPLFTSIIYFEDNDCPTLITDITRDMYNNNDFKNTKQMIFSFPKILKNLVFEGGKYLHGESYLYDRHIKNRKALVIAVWDKENKPLNIPYFDNIFYYYQLFFKFNRSIKDNEHNQFDKNNKIFLIKSREYSFFKIKCDDYTLINYDFFYKLIIKKDKKILYRLKHIFDKIENLDTIIIDYSDLIIKQKYQNMNIELDIFNMSFDNNIINNKEFSYIDKEFILDKNKKNISILEKYIYDISLFNLNLINKTIEDVQISFNITNNIKLYNCFDNNDIFPLFTSATFLEDCDKPFIITDIDVEKYKYKNFEGNKSLLLIPKKMLHIVFNGNYYYNNYNVNSLIIIINIWKKNDRLNFQTYNNNNFLYKDELINYTFKESISQPIQIYTETNIYEELLYNNNNLDFIQFICNKNEYYILNIKNKDKTIIESLNKYKKIQKMKFIQNI
jgi:GR25 family glycosyltransferase involved in LPS biosynthesis